MGWGTRNARLFMKVESDRVTPVTTMSQRALGASICSKRGSINVRVYADRYDPLVEHYRVELYDWGGRNVPDGRFRKLICSGTMNEGNEGNMNIDQLIVELARRLEDPTRRVETLIAIGGLLDTPNLVPQAA